MQVIRTVAVVMLLIVVVARSHGQKKFSIPKVTVADLEQTTYPKDTTAQAVILFDIGHFYGSSLLFSRNMRVKILKKGGLNWGNWVFNTPSTSQFKVTVYNLENGQVVPEKAADKSIFTEQVINEFNVYKVFAPNVKVGSVIDISYEFLGVPFEWRFQERVPVIYSELVMEESTFATFKRTFFGFEPIQTISPDEWHAVNMPAFKAEPFINNYSNYLSKFQFQIESVMRLNARASEKNFLELSTTWPKAIDLLLKIPEFGSTVTGCGFLNEFAKETNAQKDLTVKQKVEVAIQHIRKNLKWNQHNTIFASTGLRNNFLVDHDGSTADINLALIALLNKMNIKTYPVVLSTRDNGMLVEYSATISKFNFVVGLIQHEGIKMLVDATSVDTRPGILPSICLNGKGLVVRKDSVQWVDLNQGFKNVTRQFTDLEIEKDGAAIAKIIRDFEGYGYLAWIDTLKANNKDTELLKNKISKENPDLKVLSYSVASKDTVKGVSQEAIDIDLSAQVVDTGAELLLNPFVLFEYSSNPLNASDRKFPLDLWSPRDATSTVAVRLPKGYGVLDLPPSEKFSIPDGSASFTYLTASNNVNNTVQLKIVLKLTKAVYTESEYLEMRQFLSHVVKKLNTPIRLNKT